MAIKAKKGQTTISRPYTEKMEKIRPLSLYNRGYIYIYIKYSAFSVLDVELLPGLLTNKAEIEICIAQRSGEGTKIFSKR